MHASQRATAKPSRTTLPSLIGDDWSSGDKKANQITMLGVPKYVPIGHENGPRGRTSGAISAGSGDRIRTCDLWVMS